MAIDVEELEKEREAPPADAPADATVPLSVDGEPIEELDDDEDLVERPPIRIAIAVAFPVLAAAVMVGGVFLGVSPRIYGAVAGLLGVGLGAAVSRLAHKPMLTYAALIVGLFALGPIMLLPNVGDMIGATGLVREATAESDVLRPPVIFLDGWKVIQGWLMGLLGFTAAWLAIVVRWRSAALLLPLPIAAIAGISVPDNAQIPSGIATLVLFAIGLGLLSSEQSAGDDDEARPPLSYEIRKALKALPVIGAITVALFFLAQTDFLFPDPAFDPAQEPQKPKTQPLSQAPDRPLFEVTDTELTGPFRTGSLDVYDGQDWRLPPFAASELEEVPESGIVDQELAESNDVASRLQATITVRGLTGAILPSLPNTLGLRASGPTLSYDQRNGNIRLVNGTVEAGLTYTVVAAALPEVSALKEVDFADLPEGVEQFREIGEPPLAVQSLIDQAPKTSKWEEFDFLRSWILDNVTVTGTGVPVSIDAARVADMISGSKEGSPFEIVAAQAMLARWIDIPSRIGYGFDGGDKVGEALVVRPRNGANFVEVYFPGFKWLPVIGTPKLAEPTVGGDPEEQLVDPSILPSDDVEAQLFIPKVVPPASVAAKQVAVIVLVVLPLIGLVLAAYFLYPAVRKAQLRARRRARALEQGPRARVALAYAEWRNYAADLGFLYPAETPLMFLERFADDEEHRELAWLTTRVLWGDLRDDVDAELATIAEELSRSLRRRLGSVQAASLRAVGAISRISLRQPFLPDPAPRRTSRRLGKERAHEVVPA